MRDLSPERRSPERRAALPAASAVALLLAVLAFVPMTQAAPESAAEALRIGSYTEAIPLAAAAREEFPAAEVPWHHEIEALLALGRYADALTQVEAALEEFPISMRLRLLGLEAARFAGQPLRATQLAEEIRIVLFGRRGYIRDEDHLVDLGEAALLLGAEPRLVLDNFFKPAQNALRPARRAFLVAGRLALDKGDDALAGRTFEAGLGAFPDDPDMLAGLAAAFVDGDRAKAIDFATRALAVNPHHAAAHLILADHLIDAEQLDDAGLEIDHVIAVNPHHPDALALRAVIAHLREDPAAARLARSQALATWSDNPRVDYAIGAKLAQRYRFTEAAESLRLALARDADFAPARIELAQTLLRLGRDDEGWLLAHEAHQADQYSVAAFNLANLHDRVTQLAELRSAHFIVRMGANEAPVYGDRALALLERARDKLTARYGLELDQVTTVEIFPDPKDFAVRTFGMPGVPGFLGVCFGPVVTVNSPATRRANWEAVLWHEFAHTITLALTRNRMPRWLSEGISVYEEVEENPAWGRRMTIDWHHRLTGDSLRPIASMSAAFLEADTGEDMQFAYFHSYLVVRHLVEAHGFERLRELLVALGAGEPMNTALARIYGPLEELDRAFAQFATAEAGRFAGGLALDEPDNPAAQLLAAFQPATYQARLERAFAAAEARDWATARDVLEELTAGDRYFPGPESPHRLLAGVYRSLGDTAGEERALRVILAHEAGELEPVIRLHELAVARDDPDAMADLARRWIAIQPLAEAPWRTLLAAGERGEDARGAARAGRVLLELDPPDRPSIHHRIARQLRALDPVAARNHVLLALEEAPRFRAAHDLLAELPPGSTTP